MRAKKFQFFIKPNKYNLDFSKLINRDKKFNNISLEIISKKTELKKITITINNFRSNLRKICAEMSNLDDQRWWENSSKDSYSFLTNILD